MDTINTRQHAELVRLLRLARQATGLSQAQAGLACGRTQQWIALIEGGQRRVDVVEFLQLARCLQFDPFELIAKLMRVKG